MVNDGAKLPPGREFNADVAAVGVDAQDRVYAFNRGAHPMVVFDREGNFLRSWGEGVFHRAHGVHVAPDDTSGSPTTATISCATAPSTARCC